MGEDLSCLNNSYYTIEDNAMLSYNYCEALTYIQLLPGHKNCFRWKQKCTSNSAVADKPTRRAASRKRQNFNTVMWP